MRNIEKICIGFIIIIGTPLIVYLTISGVLYGRLLLGFIILIIVMICICLRKRVLNGKINRIEIKTIDEQGLMLNTFAIMSPEDVVIISEIFNKKAEVSVNESFEYIRYAIYIYLNKKKPVILYPDKNDIYKVKVNKHIWGVSLNENEGEEFRCIMKKYNLY